MDTQGNIVLIPLSRGFKATIDAADWPRVSQHKWHARPDPRGNIIYAQAATPRRKGFPRKTLQMHIVIMGGPFVDHIDGDGLNNRRNNLRFATRSQNRRNSSAERQTFHGMKGVDYQRHRGDWRARIYVDGKRLHLGSFQSSEEAGRAYDAAARQYFGEFARLNFPD